MYCGILSFRAPAGTGTIAQNVPNVKDARTNVSFQAKMLLFFSGSCPANTLAYNPTALENTIVFEQGIWLDNGKSGVVANGELPQFGVKTTTNGGGPNRAVLNYEADSFFGGTLYRKATVTAVGVGDFDLEWEITNDWFTTDIICVAFGGTDFNYEILDHPFQTGTHATANELVALLRTTIPQIDSSGSPAGSAGYMDFFFGWATNRGVYGAAAAFDIGTGAGGDNNRVQKTNTYALEIQSAGTAIGDCTISAWDPTSFTVANGNNSLSGQAIGFSGVSSAAGNFQATAADGQLTIQTGIYPAFFMICSVNGAPSAAVRTDMMNFLVGVADGTNQMSFWIGENSTTLPLNGTRYLSDSQIGQLATPAEASTVLHTNVSVAAIHADGRVVLNFTSVDGNSPEFIWFALGDPVSLTPAQPGAGIYKLVPEKLNDTIYEDATAGTEIEVKIPDPFADLYLAGDE